jgi:hypothetical protein
MMKREKGWSLFLAVSVVLGVVSISSQAHARAGIELGIPGYGGNGCPQGTASATLSPDNTELSILFDAYTAEAYGAKTVDRKTCNLAIPVRVPQGYSFSVIAIDYRGFNALPRGASSSLNVEYFFAGQRGPRFTRNFVGPVTDNYTVSNRLGVEAVVWSACGAETTLRINTNVMARTNYQQEQAMASVDSIDLAAGLIYHLAWRQCR